MAHPESVKIVDLTGTQLRFWRRKIASGAGLNEAAQKQLETAFGAGSYERAMSAKTIDALLSSETLADTSEAAAVACSALGLPDDGATAESAKASSRDVTGSIDTATEQPRQGCEQEDPGHT